MSPAGPQHQYQRSRLPVARLEGNGRNASESFPATGVEKIADVDRSRPQISERMRVPALPPSSPGYMLFAGHPPLDTAVRHGVCPTIAVRAGACSNIWHLDELCLMINGERGWLWRAVDDAGDVLDIVVQRRRSARAATRFFRKLLKGLRMVPCAIVTDRLASYAAAKAVVELS
jgi:hypothetical protein